MKKIIKVTQSEIAPFNLTWIINNICTNQCSYCPGNLHNGTNHNYDWSKVRQFFKELFRRHSTVHCSVAGGEPSLSPFLEELVEIFKENNSTIGITSNAAKPVSYWDRIAPNLNYISFSWHAEFIDKNFREKVLAAAMKTPVTVRVMMHPLHWERSLEELKTWEENLYVRAECVRILDWGAQDTDSKSWTYTDEQNDFFNSYVINKNYYPHSVSFNMKFSKLWSSEFYFDDETSVRAVDTVTFINKGQTNFYGYRCAAGLKAMYINFSGMIYLANCQSGGSIGNILDPDNIRWPTTPITCDKNICNCISDVLIAKWQE
jgi:organic radical activating enzyme